MLVRFLVMRGLSFTCELWLTKCGIARVIQCELLGEFSNRNELSNWFDRHDTPPTALTKKPNPRNEKNASKLQELEVELARYVFSGPSSV